MDSRFGQYNLENITSEVDKSVPKNTINSHKSVWNQFTKFCIEKNHELTASTTKMELSNILADWGFNQHEETIGRRLRRDCRLSNLIIVFSYVKKNSLIKFNDLKIIYIYFFHSSF